MNYQDNVFVARGHGYEFSESGPCTAFDGYTVLTNPLGGFGYDSRESRHFPRKDGSAGVTYDSFVIQLATREHDRDLYLLMHNGSGREVLRIPTFHDGGALREHILAMPERLQYALLFQIWKTASLARDQGAIETRQKWSTAFVEKRIKKRRATKTRGARVEIVPA